MLKKLIALALLPIACFAANDQKLLQTKMISDLDIIKNTFEVKYAPAEWKKKYANWDLEEKINEAKAQILANDRITVKDYQKIVAKFFVSTRDYHTNVIFYSTEASLLPFRVRGAENRYFVSWIDNRLTDLPLAVGDEVLTINGQPVGNIVAELKKSVLGNPESKTDQSQAEMFLTARSGGIGMDAQKGKVTLVVQHVGAKNPSTYQTEWIYLPEVVDNSKVYKASPERRGAKRLAIAQPKKQVPWMKNSYFHKPMRAPFHEMWHNSVLACYKKVKMDLDNEDPADPIAAAKSFVPNLGEIIWQSPPGGFFHAYIFLTPDNKTVGYVRIPIFIGDDDEAEQFKDLIEMFQEQTNALVIDEVDNPGGEVFYLYALMSMLADKPLELPTHRVTITQEDVVFAHSALEQFKKYGPDDGIKEDDKEETISGYPITPALIAALTHNFQFTIDEWSAGRTFTSPDYVYGIKAIEPHATTRYTKPILVLVNEMSFSCADFFPAVMQDNKRAVIFGSRTAGAGGCVLSHTHPNKLGIAGYTFTGSIAERKDKQPIENLGVKPDIAYEITPADLQNNYAGYAEAVRKALQQIMK